MLLHLQILVSQLFCRLIWYDHSHTRTRWMHGLLVMVCTAEEERKYEYQKNTVLRTRQMCSQNDGGRRLASRAGVWDNTHTHTHTHTCWCAPILLCVLRASPMCTYLAVCFDGTPCSSSSLCRTRIPALCFGSCCRCHAGPLV